MRLLTLALMAVLPWGCLRPPMVQEDWRPEWDRKAAWIRSQYRGETGREMPASEARRIVRAVEKSAYRRSPIREEAPFFADEAYASIRMESAYLKEAIGDDGRSYGLRQIELRTAAMLEGRRVAPNELLWDLELNIDLGVRHMVHVGTVQAYNAGATGARKGRGCPHARKVLRTLKELPWVRRDRKGGLDQRYLEFFDFSRCQKNEKGRVGR